MSFNTLMLFPESFSAPRFRSCCFRQVLLAFIHPCDLLLQQLKLSESNPNSFRFLWILQPLNWFVNIQIYFSSFPDMNCYFIFLQMLFFCVSAEVLSSQSDASLEGFLVDMFLSERVCPEAFWRCLTLMSSYDIFLYVFPNWSFWLRCS